MADRKRESLVPSGIDTSASGYAVKDGKCSILHNLRLADGAWRNIRHFARRRPYVQPQVQDVTYSVHRSAVSEGTRYGVTSPVAVGVTLYRLTDTKAEQMGVISSVTVDSGLVTVVVGGKEYTLRRNALKTLTLHEWTDGYNSVHTLEETPVVGHPLGYVGNGYEEVGIIARVTEVPQLNWSSSLNDDVEDSIEISRFAPNIGDMTFEYYNGALVPKGTITAVKRYPKIVVNGTARYLDGDAPAPGLRLYSLSSWAKTLYGTISKVGTSPVLYGYVDGQERILHFPEIPTADTTELDVYSYASSEDERQFRYFGDADADALGVYLEDVTPALGMGMYMWTGGAMVRIDTIASVTAVGDKWRISGYSRMSNKRIEREAGQDRTASSCEEMTVIGTAGHLAVSSAGVTGTVRLLDGVSNDLYPALYAFEAQSISSDSAYLLTNGASGKVEVKVGTEVWDIRTNLIGSVTAVTEQMEGIYDVTVRDAATGRSISIDSLVVRESASYGLYASFGTARDTYYDLGSLNSISVILTDSSEVVGSYSGFSVDEAFTESVTINGITKSFGQPTAFPGGNFTCIELDDGETAYDVTSSGNTVTLYGYDDVAGGAMKYLARSSASAIAVGDHVSHVSTETGLRDLGTVTERKNRTFRNLGVTGYGTISGTYDTGETETVHATEGYDMLYRHPASAEGRFIADKHYTSGGSVHHVLVEVEVDASTGSVTETQHSLMELDAGHEYTCHHFGKVLIVNDHTAKAMTYLMLVDGRYVDYDATRYELGTEVTFREDSDHVRTAETARNDLSGYKDIVAYVDYIYRDGEECWPDHANDYWRGEIAFFAALRSPDGEILKTSDVKVINTHMRTIGGSYGFVGRYGTICTYKDQSWISVKEVDVSGWGDSIAGEGPNVLTNMYIPTLTITKSSAISEEDSFVGDVAIYCTRLNRSLDTKKIASLGTSVERRNFREIGRDEVWDLYRDNELLDQPFYLMKTYGPSAFRDGRLEVDLKYELLENLAQAKTYEATQSTDRLHAEGMLEYNGILHLYDVTTRVDIGNPFRMSGTSTPYRNAVVSYTVDSVRHSSAVVGSGYLAANQGWYIVVNCNTASSVTFTGQGNASGLYQAYRRVALKSSDALGKAYVMNRSTSGYLPYADIVIPNTPSGEVVEADASGMEYRTTNRMQCSADNNCLSYPYARSYRVGRQTSRIISANSVAVEISDSKFGEYPLYVFTTEGIFAMQNGSAVLYASINPISHETIVNPVTLAANYCVLFVTRRGVMALSRKGIEPMSTPLNSQTDVVPSLFATCDMLYCPLNEEVLIPDTANSRAYVLSLKHGMWYTRDLPAMDLLNDGIGILKAGDSTLKYVAGVYDLRDEMDAADTYGGNPSPVRLRFATRPLKMGSLELKRLETLILRMTASASASVKVTITGGMDANTMHAVKEETIASQGDILIRRTNASFRYLCLAVDTTTPADVAMSCLDMEYYMRPSRRLR